MSTTGKPSTYVKSFFADSINSAMEQAQRELGAEAMLLDSREAPPEARHLGEYEVVFGTRSDSPAAAASPAPRPPGGSEAFRRQMKELRELLDRRNPAGATQRSQSQAVADVLMDSGIDPALARKLGESARQRIARRSVPCIGAPRPSEAPNPLRDAAEEISANFEVAPEIGRVTALVGPPGCGKTTTLVKLAITQGLAQGRAVRLISADTHRIGGAEQLRTYAGILGVPFQAVETMNALAQAVDSAPASALLLIDTPGYSPQLLQELGGDLAAFLTGRQDIDTHLILTASMRLEDLYHIAGLYEAFRPSKLLFTRLDETSSLAAVFCVAARRKKPVSFLASGQSIPEDLAPAAKERIVDSLVRQLPSTVEAVA